MNPRPAFVLPVPQRLRAKAALFLTADDGVALVEFAMVLPMMLLVFAVIIEGSRLMMSYQTAIIGVRDATRYFARTLDQDACTKGTVVTGYASTLLAMVNNNLAGQSVFPPQVTVNSVTPSYVCVTGTYRHSPLAVAQVTARITVIFPFGNLFSLVGGGSLPTLVTTVTDHSRVYGS